MKRKSDEGARDPALAWMDTMSSMRQEASQKLMTDLWDYTVDFWQRWILFMDIMRRRGNIMLDHHQEGMPPLLDYEYEVILDAREFDPPANYQLLSIIDPGGRTPAPGRRPLVIIDPRAGHGPGIGGFKRDSEVGMGLEEGHPVYFVAFTPEPCPGQTIEHVEKAQARFLEEVRRRHPDRDLPIVYGNCQAGWAVAMLGADRPDVTGPVVINGAPLSYWAGSEGVNPMRLTGGLTGGAWLTRLVCDLEGGRFDGAHLVRNFENLNPANTIWSKPYAVFADPEGQEERFLEFERWWTGFYQLNEEEILWIVNNLFVGDKLEQGKLELGPDHVIDMRKMEDPLVIFASGGDNITPPHQALHWISQVYPTTEDLKKAGQRIVYLINPHVGHLGIFVSASVARREHRAIIEHIERIKDLPPGLYEMVIERETEEADPLKDQFELKFVERDVSDVRFPVVRGTFDRAASSSRANEELYLKYGRPVVRAMTAALQPEMVRWLNPARVRRYAFSDRVNPAMSVFEHLAHTVRQNRKKVDTTNTYLYAERRFSDAVVTFLDGYRRSRDNASELTFRLLYNL